MVLEFRDMLPAAIYLVFVCIACRDFGGRLLVWFGLVSVFLHVTLLCIRFRTPGVCGLALDYLIAVARCGQGNNISLDNPVLSDPSELSSSVRESLRCSSQPQTAYIIKNEARRSAKRSAGKVVLKSAVCCEVYTCGEDDLVRKAGRIRRCACGAP